MENILTIGISTRALFDSEYENSIFVEQGAAATVLSSPEVNYGSMSQIRIAFDGDCVFSQAPIRTAIVTARSAPSHERVIRTFRSWGVRIDEAHFLGGMDKTAVLKAFGANIFFDDNEDNIKAASNIVLAAKVPNFLRVV